MTKGLRRIRSIEFADNLVRVFSLVGCEREPVVAENDEGDSVDLRPLETLASKRHTDNDSYDAFRSAFGGTGQGYPPDQSLDKRKPQIMPSSSQSLDAAFPTVPSLKLCQSK